MTRQKKVREYEDGWGDYAVYECSLCGCKMDELIGLGQEMPEQREYPCRDCEPEEFLQRIEEEEF